MTNYKGVIFDLFGTLVPIISEKTFQKLMISIANSLRVKDSALKKAWIETRFLRATGYYGSSEQTLLALAEKLGSSPSPDRIIHAVTLYKNFFLNRLTPRHDALLTLQSLHKMGLNLGLITDCTLEVPPLWKLSPLSKYIKEAIFSAEVKIHKPNPEIYLMMLKKLHLRAEECLYVGDGGSQELTGAMEIGIDAVQLFISKEQINKPLRYDEDIWKGRKINSLKEILEIV